MAFLLVESSGTLHTAHTHIRYRSPRRLPFFSRENAHNERHTRGHGLSEIREQARTARTRDRQLIGGGDSGGDGVGGGALRGRYRFRLPRRPYILYATKMF